MMKASVIILNYNRQKEVLELLSNLDRQTYKPLETIVVDNHSTDGSLKLIRQQFHEVKLLRLRKNYAKAGFNFGMKRAKGEALILFDSDVLIKKDTVEKYVKRLKEKDLGLACAAVFTPQGEYFGPAYDPKRVKNGSVEVLYFCGSSVALTKPVFNQVGGYEPRFFLCLEELDWATRMRLAGFKVKVFPEIQVVNQQSVAGGDYRQWLGFYYARNWLWYYAKYLPLTSILTFMKKHLGSIKYRVAGEASMSFMDILKGLVRGLLGIRGFLKERIVVNPSLLKDIKENVFLSERYNWREGISTRKRE